MGGSRHTCCVAGQSRVPTLAPHTVVVERYSSLLLTWTRITDRCTSHSGPGRWDANFVPHFSSMDSAPRRRNSKQPER
jgi:hypothetical protein